MDTTKRLRQGGTVCVFCQIIDSSGRGRSEAVDSSGRAAPIVLDEAECVAFLDHRPLFPGHTLLVPRVHVETLGELDPGLVAPLFLAAQRLARAVEAALGAEGSFVALNNRVSQSVPHLHVHVVPRRKGDGLRGFFWPRQKYPSDAAMEETAAKLRATLTSL
jgi:histidine triad (HIT) family protein